VYRCGADGVPVFVQAGAPTDDELHALLHTVIARLMKMLTRRGVLIEEMGQTWLAEPDADGDEARTLRPLQVAAITYCIAFGPRAGHKVLTLRGAMAREGMARELLCSDIDGFSRVVPQGPPKDEQAPGVAASGVQCEAEPAQVGPGRISWARLLKRVLATTLLEYKLVFAEACAFGIDMQHCPNCGAGELKIITAILERPVIEKILAHLGLDAQPPPKGRVREAGLHFAA
jgi:hypothetical protein